jgi:excisionase family DNA binding protein
MAVRVPDPKETPTISVEEAALLFGIGRNQAYEAVQRGEIPSLRFRRSIRVPTAKCLDMLGLTPGGEN